MSTGTNIEKHREEIQKSIFHALQLSPKGLETDKYCSIYDSGRVQAANGRRDATTYLGRVWNHEMIKVAEQHLKNKLLPDDKIQRIYKSEYAGRQVAENESGDSYHTYLTINAHEAKGNYKKVWIVDVLHRNLFMLHRGRVEKWSSPYAEYLFSSLPPVFVGTIEEMEQLNEDLAKRRHDDIWHKDDNLGDNMRWFRDPFKSYDFYD